MYPFTFIVFLWIFSWSFSVIHIPVDCIERSRTLPQFWIFAVGNCTRTLAHRYTSSSCVCGRRHMVKTLQGSSCRTSLLVRCILNGMFSWTFQDRPNIAWSDEEIGLETNSVLCFEGHRWTIVKDPGVHELSGHLRWWYTFHSWYS